MTLASISFEGAFQRYREQPKLGQRRIRFIFKKNKQAPELRNPSSAVNISTRSK
jgi:hypothetical protein